MISLIYKGIETDKEKPETNFKRDNLVRGTMSGQNHEMCSNSQITIEILIKSTTQSCIVTCHISNCLGNASTAEEHGCMQKWWTHSQKKKKNEVDGMGLHGYF